MEDKDKNDLVEKIKDHIKVYYIMDKDGDLPVDVSLLREGYIDSFAFISIITYLETEFHIAIPDDDIVPEHMGSIIKMADYVLERREQK